MNGILIYEDKRNKPNVIRWFDITPSVTRKPPLPYINQISFNPCRHDQIAGSGPNGTLALFMIEQNSELKRAASVVGVQETAKQSWVTGHVWQEDADYIACCTANGHIIVSNFLKAEVTQKMHFPKEHFIGIQLHQHGLVVATQNCGFFLFQQQKINKVVKFTLTTKWVPKIS